MFWNDEVRGRVVRLDNGEIWFAYRDGTCVKAGMHVLKNILLGFRNELGLGHYEHQWDWDVYDTLMDIPGETLLIFTDDYIKIYDSSVLNEVISQENPLLYVSAAEYAEMHKCSVSRIKKLCGEGRILGSIKISGKWFIYRYADYPADKRSYNRKKKIKGPIKFR